MMKMCLPKCHIALYFLNYLIAICEQLLIVRKGYELLLVKELRYGSQDME